MTHQKRVDALCKRLPIGVANWDAVKKMLLEEFMAVADQARKEEQEKKMAVEYARNIYGPYGFEIEEDGDEYAILLNDEELKRVPASVGQEDLLKAIESCI
jgi:hypothetical protein